MPDLIDLQIDRDARQLERPRTHAAPALVLPLDTTLIEVHAGARIPLDRSAFVVVPARRAHRIVASSTGGISVVTLVIGPSARELAAAEYAPHFDDRKLDTIVAAIRKLPRTRWVDELVQRYVFEREVCEKHASSAARFLEVELTKELFFLGSEQLEQHTRTSVLFEGDTTAQRARRWLEEHLFEPFSIAALARHCAASASTVLRAFRREVGVPPAVYVRQRRLEEALHLLESGRYAVTEIAARVGYDNPSAFAVAFRARFGMSPSRARARIGPRTLPAHGTPPVRRRRRRS